MLRKVVGDDAFFAALKLYLETNKFKAVEVHHLRLAFEEVTGQDLNWFFNEWFFSPGHPEILISYHYDDSLHRQYVFTEQNQDQGSAPVYQMPVAIDFYNNNDTSIRKEIVLKNPRDTFVFFFPEKPRLVNFDAEKMLLAVKNDRRPGQGVAGRSLAAPAATGAGPVGRAAAPLEYLILLKGSNGTDAEREAQAAGFYRRAARRTAACA